MIEFGEQLRKAREEKGMTQQSLAEKLYVTRQSVSRWEHGDRYPDLLTTKKLSQILEVSLDDLLSGNEMVKIAERNPVIENKLANGVMITLYAFVIFSLVATAVDLLVRFPLLDHGGIQSTVVNVLGLVIQTVIFTYGSIHAIKGSLSPKRMGIVIMFYFATICMIRAGIVFSEPVGEIDLRYIMMFTVAVVIPNILGAVASGLYFISAKNNSALSVLIVAASLWGMFQIILSNYQLIRFAGQYASMSTTLEMLLKLCIYALIIYQTYVLNKKRKNAVEIS